MYGTFTSVMSKCRRQAPKLLCLKQWMMFDVITLQTYGVSENMLAVVNVTGFCMAPVMCKTVKWLVGTSFCETFVTPFVQSEEHGIAG